MYWNFSSILLHPEADGFEKLSRARGGTIAEIGFGNGEFVAHLARTRRSSLIVGFEVSQWCVTKAARRAIGEGADGVRLVWGDARFLMDRVFRPGAVDEVYMNFPCPWPKKRHEGRRVSSETFANTLARCIAPRGKFVLATDVESYAEETRSFFASHGAFDTSGVVRDPDREYVTKYERKWRAMGRPTFEVEAVRREGAFEVEEEPFIEEESDAASRDAPTWSEAVAALESLSGDELKGDGYRVVFSEAYVSRTNAAMLRVISSDEGFEQHFYIKAALSGSTVRGKVDSVGCPYRTPGVRASVRYVASRTGIKF